MLKLDNSTTIIKDKIDVVRIVEASPRSSEYPFTVEVHTIGGHVESLYYMKKASALEAYNGILDQLKEK